MSEEKQHNNVSRREFLAGGAMLGFGAAAGAAAMDWGQSSAILNNARPDAPYELAQAECMLYSACLQCNTGCGIKCKVQNNTVTKIDGNPYNPWTLNPHLPYDTALRTAAAVDGAICPKGQSGLQTAYDPYRLRKVLKRAGKRGENKWRSVPFDQAVKEICDGGLIFKDIPGEESRRVEGLRELMVLTDAKLSKAMAEDIKLLWAEKDRLKKHEMAAAFKTKYHEHLGALIDPEHPDLGPKNNQIVCAWGRMKDGRGDLYKRFAAALGTVNAHGHTTVCQGSLYFSCKAISEQYLGGKFTQGQKFYWQADTENSRFILFVGANLFEANYGPPNRSARLTKNLASGQTKIAVVDPRFSKLASKAWKWLPVKPGTDAALAMGIIRWILEEKRYDASFLANANKSAAIAAGETSWTNASWLVALKDGKPGKFVRAADVKSASGAPLRAAAQRKFVNPETKLEEEYEEKFMVVMANGAPAAVDPNDSLDPVTGDLFVNAVLPDGTVVKSALQVLLEAAREKSLEEWAAIAEVKTGVLTEVARELTSYGKRAVVDVHRGPAQHTNGFYNVLAWMTVNMLIGNFDAKGGSIVASTYDTKGKGKLFDLNAHPGKISAFGVSSIRHGVDYEKTTLFQGYPAKRNWYPLASDIYEEVIPSIADAYPYPVKAYFLYMGAPTYALPAGHTNIEVLCDVEKLPLFVASDIVIGSTSMYADYIFPDLSFLERWEFQGSHPNMPNKVQPVRQPVMAPVPEECTVYGQQIPLSFEAMLLKIAENLKLPGFGDSGFGASAAGAPLALKHPDDLYLRAVANLAFGEKPDASESVEDASGEEQELFRKARKHLPSSVFSEARWRELTGEKLWPKVVYVLNRGGRFENYEKGYNGERAAHPYGALLNLYQEKTASTIHSGTGKPHFGCARYVPVQGFTGELPADYVAGRSLTMITHRVISQTKSRTISNPWLTPLLPENGILIHPQDAARLGLADGALVKVTSATNVSGEWPLGAGRKRPMAGKLVFTQTVRPGVISFALGFGHWATGAGDVEIDGYLLRGEKRRAAGVHANAAMWTDPLVKNTCLFDPVGGSVSFYDTMVSLEAVEGG